MKKMYCVVVFVFVMVCGMLNGDNLTPGMSNLLDSVVRLDIWGTSYESGKQRLVRSQGSGVIITEDGYILTNAHVVGILTEKIKVTLANKERVKGEFIGWDHWTDLAVVKLDMSEINKKNLKFSHASFARLEEVKMGETVYAVGTPYGLTRSMTKGIISNPMRYFEPSNNLDGYETGDFNNWYQTDAAINPGNSGGPLVDQDGQIVGINTLGVDNSNGLGFAIPVATANEVFEIIRKEGKVTRSTIGIQCKAMQELELEDEIEPQKGFLIENVKLGSPAKLAGISPGDIILTIDNQPIDVRFPEQIAPVFEMIAKKPVGSVLNLEILRGQKKLKIAVTTELLESRVGEKFAFEEWGLTVEKLTKTVARDKRLEDEEGFLIIGVKSGFPAAEAGISKGDVIKKINEKKLESMGILKEFYNEYVESPQKLFVEVIRGDVIKYFVIRV